MTLPKQFHVKGKLWRLEYKWRLVNDDGVLCDGLCVPATRMIYIDRLVEKDRKPGVFLHELNHAILFESHLGEMGGVDGFQEEVICASISDVYTSLFTLKLRKAKDDTRLGS
jgi:hypothetical protein